MKYDLKKTQRYALSVAILLSFALVFLFKSGESVAFYSILLFAAIAHYGNPEREELSDENARLMKLFTYSMLLYVVPCAAIDFVNGEPLGAYERYIVWIVAPALAMGVYSARIPASVIWLAATVASVVGFTGALYGAHVLELDQPSMAITNPIFFGNICLLVGWLALCGAADASLQPGWMRFLHLGGYFLGTGAALLSASKGGLVALPALFAALWFFGPGAGRPKLVIAILTIAALAFGVLFPGSAMLQRLQEFQADVWHWLTSEIAGDQTIGGSGAARLELWKFGVHAFLESPLFGMSGAQMQLLKEEYVARGVVHPVILNPELISVHNEILDHAVRRGLFGLAAITIFYGGIIWFLTTIRRRIGYHPVNMAGFFAIIMLMLFGMSNPHLIFNDSRHPFALVIALLVAANLLARDHAGVPPSRKSGS